MRSRAEVREAISALSRSVCGPLPLPSSGGKCTLCGAAEGNFGPQLDGRGAEAREGQDFDQDASNDTAGDATMSLFTSTERLFASSILLGVAAALVVPAAAQQKAAPPDFSSDNVGWVGLNGGGPFYEPVPGRIPPVTQDPAHPFVPNGVGRQPTFRIADLTNPNLKPWVKERMKKDNDEVLAGKVAFTPSSSCMPAGVPGFLALAGNNNPVWFLQTPKEVLLMRAADSQVRRVYLDVPHSPSPKPSWYGESVGHYEGDTLVIDTIGLNAKTFFFFNDTANTEK